MFRFCPTVLLLCAYFASQLAVVPHVHGVETEGHSLRQHIHLVPAAKHSHGHGDHSHAHHHKHSHSHGDGQPSEGLTQENHDDSCIYLPDSLLAATQAQAHSLDFSKTDVVVYAALPASIDEVAKVTSHISSAPPDVLRHGSDLCVTLRTLRI